MLSTPAVSRRIDDSQGPSLPLISETESLSSRINRGMPNAELLFALKALALDRRALPRDVASIMSSKLSALLLSICDIANRVSVCVDGKKAERMMGKGQALLEKDCVEDSAEASFVALLDVLHTLSFHNDRNVRIMADGGVASALLALVDLPKHTSPSWLLLRTPKEVEARKVREKRRSEEGEKKGTWKPAYLRRRETLFLGLLCNLLTDESVKKSIIANLEHMGEKGTVAKVVEIAKSFLDDSDASPSLRTAGAVFLQVVASEKGLHQMPHIFCEDTAFAALEASLAMVGPPNALTVDGTAFLDASLTLPLKWVGVLGSSVSFNEERMLAYFRRLFKLTLGFPLASDFANLMETVCGYTAVFISSISCCEEGMDVRLKDLLSEYGWPAIQAMLRAAKACLVAMDVRRSYLIGDCAIAIFRRMREVGIAEVDMKECTLCACVRGLLDNELEGAQWCEVGEDGTTGGGDEPSEVEWMQLPSSKDGGEGTENLKTSSMEESSTRVSIDELEHELSEAIVRLSFGFSLDEV